MAQPRDHGRTRAKERPTDAELAAIALMTFEPYPASIVDGWTERDRFGLDFGLRVLSKTKAELVLMYRDVGNFETQKAALDLVHETEIKLKAAAKLMKSAEARLIAVQAVFALEEMA